MSLLEQNLISKISRVGASKQVIALLLDLSDTVLCRWLACTRPMPGPESSRINKLLDDLLRIQQIIYPLSMPLQDVPSLKVLLQRYRDSGLDHIVDRATLDEMRREIESIQAL